MPSEFFCVYEGSTEPVSCQPEDFCDNDTLISYEPNTELSDTYDNWISKLDLVCATPSQIGLIGTSLFLGWCITLTFVPRLADLYGRKYLMRGGTTVLFLAYTVLMITHDYVVFICALFVIGLMCTTRAQVGIIYMFENSPKRLINPTMTCFFIFEAVIGILGAIYFTWISKDAFGFMMLGYSFQIIGTITVYCIPESPKWLVKKGLIQEAQVVFERIARTNKVDTELVSLEKIEELFGNLDKIYTLVA